MTAKDPTKKPSRSATPSSASFSTSPVEPPSLSPVTGPASLPGMSIPPQSSMAGIPSGMPGMPGVPTHGTPTMPISPGQGISGMPMLPGMPMPPGHGIPGMAMAPGQGMPTGFPALAPQITQMQVVQMQTQMLQMMQLMMGGAGVSGVPGVDPAALPFSQVAPVEDEDAGLDADVIRPHQLRSVVKTQQALSLNEVLDRLCLTEDGKYALAGVPKGCTIAFVGPPGQGKTRTALDALCRVAARGIRCAFVVAEEGFLDQADSGRDDLCSRLTKIGMKSLQLSEAQFQKKVARHLAVIQSQYHKGHTWDSFVARYRLVVEKEGVRFVVLDSLNSLDPTKTKTADNLSALKTYNHEKGVTCLTIGQIRDTGMPVGGEALIHTADVVFLLEELSLTSKEMAAFWGGEYRERLMTMRAIKSVTTPIFPYPVRIARDAETGVLKVHPQQPASYSLLPLSPTTVQENAEQQQGDAE